MEFKTNKSGSAEEQVARHLKDSGFEPSKRHGDVGSFYKHPKTGKEVYVTHYPKIGVSHIDEETMESDSPIYEMIISHMVEGTAGDTNLIDRIGNLTRRGYAAAYAWKKAGHKGQHPAIKMEKAAKEAGGATK